LVHEYSFVRKRGTVLFPYVFCMFFVTCEWTCASKVDYSGEGRTSTG
jgi:hypothetical protein